MGGYDVSSQVSNFAAVTDITAPSVAISELLKLLIDSEHTGSPQ